MGIVLVGNCCYMTILIMLLFRECLYEKREKKMFAKRVWKWLEKSKVSGLLGEYREETLGDMESEASANSIVELRAYGAGAASDSVESPHENESLTQERKTATPEVPLGWERIFDPASQRHYFYHDATGTTQWHSPGEEGEDVDEVVAVTKANPVYKSESANDSRSSGEEERLPEGWEKICTEDGEVYYVSPIGESQWEKPTLTTQ